MKVDCPLMIERSSMARPFSFFTLSTAVRDASDGSIVVPAAEPSL
jgi:hypothetical protein